MEPTNARLTVAPVGSGVVHILRANNAAVTTILPSLGDESVGGSFEGALCWQGPR